MCVVSPLYIAEICILTLISNIDIVGISLLHPHNYPDNADNMSMSKSRHIDTNTHDSIHFIRLYRL